MAVRGSKGPENTDEKFLSSINEMLFLIFVVEFCKYVVFVNMLFVVWMTNSNTMLLFTCSPHSSLS